MKKAFSFYGIILGSVLLSMVLSFTSGKILAQTENSEVSGGKAVIENSASTNTCPYTISVLPGGAATYTVCNKTGKGEVSSGLSKRFFEDIKTAQPLENVPFTPCVKSASFGTTTKVKYKEQTSPDISCPSFDSRVTDLYEDTIKIQQQLGFSTKRISTST
ncbi:MAG: hypothetical protein KME49_04405 [Brasilonema octagenarum HA4186-MV1]|jgi:hypothetical protein|uniref:Uncharacterized protein n=2 Tax=Brasilonema TaxID=383614 RepID=A0A856MMI7_9CYAN|nr:MULTISPECIES: hypothetical protein [Brasilonema]MBW4624757.1 hypothetical protein [Brasilonema octagenarum HA4186-MV1]NMF62746.1 hypothetical protein [Brasilonema octagenarum UFV-OR1]QDL10136.1 hypothetical protein DP114_21575 [Brasilonema sennae CENA114]QDL16489.1 hypothetical protein DP113_21500 [Brasilonema octagenarum UFV-E1]